MASGCIKVVYMILSTCSLIIYLPFAGIVRSRVSRTLYNCATKITPTARPVYLELKQEIQDKVIKILQNVGGEGLWPKALEFLRILLQKEERVCCKDSVG